MPDSELAHEARQALEHLLRSAEAWDEAERRDIDATLRFATRAPQPFDRRVTDPGHIVSSGWLLDRDEQMALLVYHEGLARWLQPGGHVEPDETDPRLAAAREILEETGVSVAPAELRLFDVEVQAIPSGRQPGHLHFDLRFLLELRSTVAPLEGARWFHLDALPELTLDSGIARMVAKSAPNLSPPANPAR